MSILTAFGASVVTLMMIFHALEARSRCFTFLFGCGDSEALFPFSGCRIDSGHNSGTPNFAGGTPTGRTVFGQPSAVQRRTHSPVVRASYGSGVHSIGTDPAFPQTNLPVGTPGPGNRSVPPLVTTSLATHARSGE